MNRKFVCIMFSALLTIMFCFPVAGTIAIEQTQIKLTDEEEVISLKSNDLFLGDNIISLGDNNGGYINRYAVIVKGPSGSAQMYRYYTFDVQGMYDTLHDYYNFTDEEIYVIFSNESYTPHEIFDPNIIDFESTETNLIQVLNMFKSGGNHEMGDNDLLFLFWIDHGGNSGGNTYFPLHKGDVWDYEFAEYVEGIKGTKVFVFQPCYSGGFIKEVSGPNRIIITSVNENEGEGGWADKFWKALRGKGDEDPEIGNQDGFVSLEEAYHYPARHVFERYGVHSLLDDNGDKKGHHYKESGYDPNDPSKDGYIAARTFLKNRGLAALANGPYFGLVDLELEFNGIACGGKPPYTYHWDFGDTYTSDEQNPTHNYTSPGNYTVIFSVTDNESNTSSDTTYAWIQTTNTQPDKPTIDGPTNGKAGTSYDYTFSATDPDNSIIYLYVEWGDGTNSGWLGPYNSGEIITKSHKWSKQGTYEIKAQVKDPYEAESEWGTLVVTMPRNKAVNKPFQNFLQQHQHIFSILCVILQRLGM